MNHQLFICSVPIGNDADISQRALACLTKVPVIFCEDTRVTLAMLRRHGILNRQTLHRMDQHQAYRSVSLLDACMHQGDVAFVSDAGSPGLSDPGSRLVHYAVEKGYRVSVLPGSSALTALIAVSGIEFTSFYFGGFFPKKQADRQRELQRCRNQQLVGIWFESPRRIGGLLKALNTMHPDLPGVIAKELTKPYEAVLRGNVAQLWDQLQVVNTNGEWVVLFDFRHLEPAETIDYHHIAQALKHAQLSQRQVKELAPLLNCSKNQLKQAYQAL